MTVCSRYQNHVTLRHPLFQNPLLLGRTPIFLRFVYKMIDGVVSWDALNELDDQPAENETVIAACLDGVSSVHIDSVVDRRRRGEWIRHLDYEVVVAPPPDDVLRDSAKWTEWCMSQFGSP